MFPTFGKHQMYSVKPSLLPTSSAQREAESVIATRDYRASSNLPILMLLLWVLHPSKKKDVAGDHMAGTFLPGAGRKFLNSRIKQPLKKMAPGVSDWIPSALIQKVHNFSLERVNFYRIRHILHISLGFHLYF